MPRRRFSRKARRPKRRRVSHHRPGKLSRRMRMSNVCLGKVTNNTVQGYINASVTRGATSNVGQTNSSNQCYVLTVKIYDFVPNSTGVNFEQFKFKRIQYALRTAQTQAIQVQVGPTLNTQAGLQYNQTQPWFSLVDFDPTTLATITGTTSGSTLIQQFRGHKKHSPLKNAFISYRPRPAGIIRNDSGFGTAATQSTVGTKTPWIINQGSDVEHLGCVLVFPNTGTSNSNITYDIEVTAWIYCKSVIL